MVDQVSASSKVNLAVVLTSVIGSIYLTEIVLECLRIPTRSDPIAANARLDQSRLEKARELGISFDLRSKLETVNQLIAEGQDAYPNYFPFLARNLGGLPVGEGRIYPLSGLSRTRTVYCNEGGFWATFFSDEHGFNNPTNLYQPGSVDAVLVGDSYVEGACVGADDTMSAHLRRQGSSVISLGKGSNGPLTQLATIKEYAGQLRPKVVFWFFATNDLSDLKEEREVAFLNNYLLESGYSQKLYFRQDGIDQAIKNFVGTEMENRVLDELLKKKSVRKNLERKKFQRYAFHSSSVVRVAKLYNLRLTLDLTPSSISIQSDILERDEVGRLFREILQEAKDYVTKWNGTLVFVYLAPYERYKIGAPHSEKEKVIDIVNELSIPVVDSHREAFSGHLDPKSFFPLGLNGHYNSDGYRVLADVLQRRLQRMGSD